MQGLSLKSEVGQPYNLSSKPGQFGKQKGTAAAQMLTLTEFQNNRKGQIRTLGHWRSAAEQVLGASDHLLGVAWTLKTRRNGFQSWFHHVLVSWTNLSGP